MIYHHNYSACKSRDIFNLSRQQFVWSHSGLLEQSRARLVMKSTIISIIAFGPAAGLWPVKAHTYTFKNITFRQSRRKVSVRKLLIAASAVCVALYASVWRGGY